MEEKNARSYRGSLLLKAALVGLALFLLGTLFVWQTKIAGKQEELGQLRTRIAAQELKNQELRKAVDALDTPEGLASYAERKARDDLGYAMPGERIFVDAGGSD